MYVQYPEHIMDKGKVQISNNKIKFECRHQFCPLAREQFNTTNNHRKVEFMQKINEEKYLTKESSSSQRGSTLASKRFGPTPALHVRPVSL